MALYKSCITIIIIISLTCCE